MYRLARMHPCLVVATMFAAAVCEASTSPPASLQACTECHGTTGVAARTNVPHLNGQIEEFLVKTARRFVDGRRATDVAAHKAFPAADIDAMSSYYAGQNAAARPAQQLDSAAIAKGEQVYNARCADCHGDSGRESDNDAAFLAGQDREYLRAQALRFKGGQRSFPFKMDEAFRGLSDEDLSAVSDYFAAQSPIAPAAPKKKKYRF
jgi:sulfide dehydrogenase cytochrome subunit